MPSSGSRPPSSPRKRPPKPEAASAAAKAEPRTGARAPAARAGRLPDDRLPSDRVGFAHDSERQYARLLDFYQIEWEYEPRTFDVEWDAEGRVIKQFSPDFYLPQFDLYIEVTTMNQKLVTKKNRKVRRLRELYPGTKIKVFYQRDYVRLLEKYGLARPDEGKS